MNTTKAKLVEKVCSKCSYGTYCGAKGDYCAAFQILLEVVDKIEEFLE